MASLLFISALCAADSVSALDEAALEARLQDLERRLAVLESGATGPAAAQPPTPAATAQPEPTPAPLPPEEVRFGKSELGMLLAAKKLAARSLPAFLEGAARGVLGRLGLRDGDLVLSVDGKPLGDPPSLVPLLDALRKNGGAVVRVEREGALLEITARSM
jgi:tRNA-binding EMAP/Myf-like protein